MPERACRYVGPAFRAHDPRWAHDPLSGQGAKLHGGRFNEKGREALYLSLSYETAYHEAARGAGLPSPMTLVSYRVACSDILDTFDQRAAAQWDLPGEELGGRYWQRELAHGRAAESHKLAERLAGEGFAGMIYPSFVPTAPLGARNLVLWRWGGRPPHRVEAHDPGGRLLRGA